MTVALPIVNIWFYAFHGDLLQQNIKFVWDCFPTCRMQSKIDDFIELNEWKYKSSRNGVM